MLTPLAKLVKVGFGKEGLAQVLAGVDGIDEKGTVAYDFPIKYEGKETSIRLIIKSKPGDVDLWLYSIPELISAYSPKLKAILSKLGA